MDTTIVTTEPPQEPSLLGPVTPPKKSAQWVPITVILSATAALIAGAVILLVVNGGSTQWSDQRVADDVNKSLNSYPLAAPGSAPPAQYRASDVPALLATDGDGGPGSDQWEADLWRVNSIQTTLQTSGRCQGTPT